MRDIVDLEATYDMSDISDKLEDTLKLIEDASPNENKNNKEKSKTNNNTDDNDENQASEDEDEDDGLNVSLVAFEEKLKPKVLMILMI